MSNDFKSLTIALIVVILFILSFFKLPARLRASRFETISLLVIAIPIAVIVMPFVIALRYLKFAALKKDHELMNKYVGYWKRIETGSRRYDLVYEVHERGTLTIHAVYFIGGHPPKALLDYRIRYKFQNGTCYQRTKVSQISIDKIIDLNANTLILKDSSVTGDMLHDVRISKEEYEQTIAEFSKHVRISHWTILLGRLMEGPGIYRTKRTHE